MRTQATAPKVGGANGKREDAPASAIRRLDLQAEGLQVSAAVLHKLRENFIKHIGGAPYTSVERTYESALSLMDGMSCSMAEVAIFTKLLEELRGDRNFIYNVGPFLSAVINGSEEREFTVFTRELGAVYHLLYRSKKNVKVIGNVGEYFCMMMEDGEVTIEGNTWCYAGFMMSGGHLTLNGKWGKYLGKGRTGGTITTCVKKGQSDEVSSSQ